MGLLREIKKAIGYTEYNKTCGTCVHCVYRESDGGGYYKCIYVEELAELSVIAEGSCTRYTSITDGAGNERG